ncbi:MAG: hypothetical protein OHK0024_14870 [Thalassobaculales bacterium]
MIGEALAWLATPCARPWRRLGYLSESIAILARHRRHRAAWAPHLAASRAAVEQAIAGGGRRALVFGSGALLDLPLAALAAGFERVTLVDLVHPWPARLAARRYANVALAVADLSGIAGEIAAGRDPGAGGSSYGLDDPTVDLVVSLNLLSQLPIVPLAELSRRGWNEAAQDKLARRLIAGHLDHLRRFACRVCLIADLERIVSGPDGTEIARIDPLHGLGLPPPDREWLWPVAPLGEVAAGVAVTHRVGAWLGFAAGAQRQSPATMTGRGS